MMDSFEQLALLQTLQTSSGEELGRQMDLLAQAQGELTFCRKGAAVLLSLARPQDAIPESLSRFAPLVRDGIELFLSRISYSRLRQVILSQSALDPSAVSGERLLDLVLHFPTLHKLGQIIARNPQLDPELKGWLIRLEHGDYGTDSLEQARYIEAELTDVPCRSAITLSPRIIAEASVASILRFSWQKTGSRDPVVGVFKVLKPRITGYLQEELQILADVVEDLERNRRHYPIKDMKLAELFREIREDLAREIDLSAEQQNLAEAARVYTDVAGVRIPDLLPFCTPDMTAMAYFEGTKITNIAGTREQRHKLAGLVFEAVLCRPLFAGEEMALFHGDPHAGNILAVAGEEVESGTVALLDWTLAGRLSKIQRLRIMELLLGVLQADGWKIAATLERMAVNTNEGEKNRRKYLAGSIKKLLSKKEFAQSDPLKKAFRLLEEMALEGVVFPAELVLYRKSFFTLEGVLRDISADFSMGKAMEKYLAALILQEMPWRCITPMTPWADDAKSYRSLISTRSLLELSLHQGMAFWQQNMQQVSSIIAAQARLTTDLMQWLAGFPPNLKPPAS